MEVEPNRVLHTSPDKLDEVENRFISKIADGQRPDGNHGNRGVSLYFGILTCTQQQYGTEYRSRQDKACCRSGSVRQLPWLECHMDRPSPIKEKAFQDKGDTEQRGAEGYQDTYDKGIAYKGYCRYSFRVSIIVLIAFLLLPAW